MNDNSTLLLAVLTFAVSVCVVLAWSDIPLKFIDSLSRLRSLRFLAEFYRTDLNEVNRLTFCFRSRARQTMVLHRWLSSHLGLDDLAILERNNGCPFDRRQMFDDTMPVAEKKRRDMPRGYERIWVMSGVNRAKRELLEQKAPVEVTLAQ